MYTKMPIISIFCISGKLKLLSQANKNLRSFPHNFLSENKQKTDVTYPCDMMCPYWDIGTGEGGILVESESSV